MSTTPSPDRKFSVALTAAVASTTLAIGVTAGALLGWIGPRTTLGEPSSPVPAGAGNAQVVYVPITPLAPPPARPIDPVPAGDPRLALAGTDSHPHDRHDRGAPDHDHDHEEHDDD